MSSASLSSCYFGLHYNGRTTLKGEWKEDANDAKEVRLINYGREKIRIVFSSRKSVQKVEILVSMSFKVAYHSREIIIESLKSTLWERILCNKVF